MNKSVLLGLIFLVTGPLLHAQTDTLKINYETQEKIYKSISKAIKKSMSKDVALYEGFVILKISNPNNPSNDSLVSSSSQIFTDLGDKILINLNRNSMPSLASEIQEIVIPVIFYQKCKKHTHISFADIKSQVMKILEKKEINYSSEIVLDEFSMMGYTHR